MNSYTPQEIAEFKAKDLRMCKMNALNRAVDIVIAKEQAQEEPFKLLTFDLLKECLEIAEKFVEWIYKDNYNQPIKPQNCEIRNKANPQPNEKQIEILSKVAKHFDETGFNVNFGKLCEYVYNKYGRYPTLEESVKKIIDEVEDVYDFVEV